MYYREDREQLSIEDFNLPFGGRLMQDNRWVRLAEIMPWEYIEEIYVGNLSEETGRPAIGSRIAFGALFIQANGSLTDEDTVQSLQENPYMQYFVGLHEFHPEPLFHSAMMVHFRKRFPVEEVAKINEYVCTGKWPEGQRNVDRNDSRNDEDPPVPPCNEGESGGKVSKHKGKANPNASKKNKKRRKKNRGKLLLDAAVAPAQHQVSHRYRPAQQEPGTSGKGNQHLVEVCAAYRPQAALFRKESTEILSQTGQKQEMDPGKMPQGNRRAIELLGRPKAKVVD